MAEAIIPVHELKKERQDELLEGINAVGELGNLAVMASYTHQVPGWLVNSKGEDLTGVYQTLLQAGANEVVEQLEVPKVEVMPQQIKLPTLPSFLGFIVVSESLEAGNVVRGMRQIDRVHRFALTSANRYLQLLEQTPRFAEPPLKWI